MESTKNNERTVTVDYWREKYNNIAPKIVGVPIFRALVFADSYFDTAKGLHDYKNVKRNKAGLVVTRRAFLALEKYLNLTKKPKEKYLTDISL